MTSQANIKIVLDAVNNAGKALEDVRAQLEGVGKQAENTTEKTGLLGGAFDNLGGLVAGFAGTAGLSYMINQATESDKSLVRLQLSLGRYSDTLRAELTPQVINAGKAIQQMGLGSDELASETIARLLPTFKNDLPRAINGASTLLTLMKYDVRGASAVLNFLGEDSDFAQIAMTKLAKAVGIDVNPKMDDLAEILEKVQARFKNITLPPFVQELGTLLGHLSDIAEGVGTKMLKIVNPLLELVNGIFKIPFVGKLAEWGTAFATVALAIGGVLKFFGVLPSATYLVTAAFKGLTAALAVIGGVLGVSVGWAAVIVAALAALGVAIYLAITHWSEFKKIVLQVWEAIKTATAEAWAWILKAFKSAAEGVVAGLNWLADKALYIVGFMVGSIVRFFSTDLPNGIAWFVTVFVPLAVTTIAAWFGKLPSLIGNALASLPSVFANIFNNVKNIVSSVLTDIWNWVGELPRRLLDSIREGINWVVDKINSFIGGYNAAVPKGMEIKAIPRLAEGGVVTRPTIAMIGEAGAEAVLPLSRLGGSGLGGATINIDFSGSVLLSENVAVQIGDKIIDRLRKNMRIPSRSF